MEYALQFQTLCQVGTRKLLFFMGFLAVNILVLRTLMLPYESGFMSSSPIGKVVPFHEKNSLNTRDSSSKSAMVADVFFSNASNLTNSLVILEVVKHTEAFDVEEEFEHDNETNGKERNLENDYALEKDSRSNNVVKLENGRNADAEPSSERVIELDNNVVEVENGRNPDAEPLSERVIELDREPEQGFSSVNKNAIEMLSKDGNHVLPHNGSATSNNSIMPVNPIMKKMRCDMPPKTIMSISEMNSLLLRRRGSYRSLRPQRSSMRDQELLSAKSQIENAPITRSDPQLYAPLFRNVSMFIRSYELMERILKVYIYREGEKPIFHQPILKGIYASEGWFMKLIGGNRKFVVKDPRKAHLFYMPFSTRMLEFALYVPNSHNRTNLAEYLKNYTKMIAAKYSFWNRTGGADHFFVACHDWAPYETRHHMERCIKALCNSDVTAGYKIGKDVSLPETYVRSAKNPQRDIGGKPPTERSILAFFAGSMHGYLRRILLSYWENKDPDMKISGPMPPGVASKMNYIQHMKSSKYCICAKGYEVNSPRVVEAIFYECIPVIISDNFVPPFFDVLDWKAFAVFVPEKDIPILKDILLSIPDEKYLAMQKSVKKVQKHFLWHSKPMKYDLFYMTLHSIWYNRVFQIRPR